MPVDIFEKLLKDRKLYFASAREFEDLHEGAITLVDGKNRNKSWGSEFNEDELKNIFQAETEAFEDLRRLTKVSCWHQSKHESDAMWRLYASQGKGIAIKSSIDRLINSIGSYRVKPEYSPEKIWLGRVNYINYETDRSENFGMLAPFFYKRQPFSWEHEIRAVVSLRLAEEIGCNVPKDGILVPITLETLIESVILSPYIQEKDIEEIQMLMNKYIPSVSIEQSILSKAPLF